MVFIRIRQLLCVTLLCVSPVKGGSSNQVSDQAGTTESASSTSFPFPEQLKYRVEWRLITAGAATLNLTSAGADNWTINLNLESAGVLSRLYRVLDKYKVTSDSKFCLETSDLDAQENKRHNVTRITVNAQHQLRYDEKDLVKNTTSQNSFDVPPCTREIAGALASLRFLNLEPGQSTSIPITDGKKLVSAKVESQAREVVSFDGKSYQTVRYEAFLFDNVLYRRKGRLFLWMTDDKEHIPVQIRIQLGFPVGNITILLEKQGRISG